MRKMAIEYQMNLTYFVRCWYCPAMVYLFASKCGGFVIFNSLGGRWPIHECYLRLRSKMKVSPMDWWEGHDAPLPFDAPVDDVIELTDGQFIEGTVVSVADKPENSYGVQHWPASICTGRVVYRLNLSAFAEAGCWITGKVRWVNDRFPIVENLKRHTPPTSIMEKLK
jgi:hypothetical protein